MRNNIKWMAALCMVAFATTIYGCNDDEDRSYDGALDLNILNLTQARAVWDGAECNINAALSVKDGIVKNLTYKLDISLYQERKAGKDATVKLAVDKDTLSKAIALASTGGIYAKYQGVELLPEGWYSLSSEDLTLRAGSTKSDAASVTVYSSMLTDYVQEKKEDKVFVLPLKISDSSSYRINDHTDALMLFLNVTYIEPEHPEDYVADTEGVPDDHTLENGMKLRWHDEFNGTGAPNKEMWRFETGFVRNEEDQWYQEGNALMSDGTLVIEGKKERVKNPNYQSGSGDWKKNREYAEYTSSCIVATGGYAFKYGRLEVRAKIPTAQGAWPAIWSTGNWWEWPLGGEIDIMEFYKEKIHANLCWGGNSRWNGTWNSKNRNLSEFTSKDPAWSEKFHLWVMDWDKDYIRIYLDGELLNETDLKTTFNKGDHGAGQGGYDNPFSNDYEGFGQLMMLNLAIGGINGRPVNNSAFPLKYYVDYVRVYQPQK